MQFLGNRFFACLQTHRTNGLQKWWWAETDCQESHSIQIGNNIVSMMRWFTGLLFYCCAVVLVYNSETSNKGFSNGCGFRGVEFGWYKSVVQYIRLSACNEAIKGWYNKQKRMSIHFWTAGKPACLLSCLPTGTPTCRQAGRQTNEPFH